MARIVAWTDLSTAILRKTAWAPGWWGDPTGFFARRKFLEPIGWSNIRQAAMTRVRAAQLGRRAWDRGPDAPSHPQPRFLFLDNRVRVCPRYRSLSPGAAAPRCSVPRCLRPVVVQSCAKRDHVAASGVTRGRSEFGLEITPSEYPLSTHNELHCQNSDNYELLQVTSLMGRVGLHLRPAD
jgi:hypothetical protein